MISHRANRIRSRIALARNRGRRRSNFGPAGIYQGGSMLAMIWPARGFCRVQFLLPGEHPNLPVSCIFRAGLAGHPRSSLGLNRQSRHRGEARSMAQERQEECRNKRSICSSGERSGEKQSFWIVNRRLSHWRPGPESNRRTRICSPLHGHSATGPEAAGSGGSRRGGRVWRAHV
jgi:hypothetical protein